jgi:hypothetical protein
MLSDYSFRCGETHALRNFTMDKKCVISQKRRESAQLLTMTGEGINVIPIPTGFQSRLKYPVVIRLIFPVHVDGGVGELIHEPCHYPHHLFRRWRIIGPDDHDR